jgi:hypothetical protein
LRTKTMERNTRLQWDKPPGARATPLHMPR